MADEEDNRAIPRQLVLLTGRLVYGPHMLTVDCTIRDFSEAGARVRLAAPQALPHELWFVNIRAAAAYSAEVVWRRDLELGLRFLHDIDLESAEDPAGRTLRRVLLGSQSAESA